MLLFDFLRVLSFSFSGFTKLIVKSGIGVTGWEVVDLFKDGIEVCKFGTGEATMSFNEYLKIYHVEQLVADCYLYLLRNH